MMRGRLSLSAIVAMSLKAFTSPLSVALIWEIHREGGRERGREGYTHILYQFTLIMARRGHAS